MKRYYVLFSNHTSGTKFYQEAKAEGIKAVISPTPRELSKCCGISLMIDEKDVEKIEKLAEDKKLDYLSIEYVEKDENRTRRYC